MNINLRLLYLYLFSFVGLLFVVIGSIRLVDLGIKVVVFKGADQYESYPISKALPEEKTDTNYNAEKAQEYQKLENIRQRQRTVSEAAAMILVGIPLYLYHWKLIQKEKSI